VCDSIVDELLNFFQFHTLSADLDLGVLSSNELQVAIFLVSNQVARAIHAIMVARKAVEGREPFWIFYKGNCCPFRVIEITLSNDRSFNPELAHVAYGCQRLPV
jgi:hypothetical protein